jgi:lipoyl(octanoyl) transferase
MAPDWRLWIDDTARPGWANMSIDQSLLDRAEHHGEVWLRLYRWDPRCLSFGRHEPASRRYDANRIRRLGLDAVRRPTGGRAVWHERELTYALASPCTRFGSLREAYLEIHAVLVDALRRLGVPAILAPRIATPSVDSGPCFTQPVGGEVLVNGKKVIGSAQLRRGGTLLQHGSILLGDDQHRVSAFMTDPGNPGPWAASEVTPLASVTLHRLIASVADAARFRWPGASEVDADPSQVLRDAAQHYPRFRSPAWTWAR